SGRRAVRRCPSRSLCPRMPKRLPADRRNPIVVELPRYPMRLNRNHRAFTLLEIIVMVGILALLATLLITKTDGIFGSAQGTIAKVFVRDSLKTALERYRLDLGSYPTTAEGLAVLLTAPAHATANWKGPSVDSLPPDPWGEP